MRYKENLNILKVSFSVHLHCEEIKTRKEGRKFKENKVGFNVSIIVPGWYVNFWIIIYFE